MINPGVINNASRLIHRLGKDVTVHTYRKLSEEAKAGDVRLCLDNVSGITPGVKGTIGEEEVLIVTVSQPYVYLLDPIKEDYDSDTLLDLGSDTKFRPMTLIKRVAREVHDFTKLGRIPLSATIDSGSVVQYNSKLMCVIGVEIADASIAVKMRELNTLGTIYHRVLDEANDFGHSYKWESKYDESVPMYIQWITSRLREGQPWLHPEAIIVAMIHPLYRASIEDRITIDQDYMVVNEDEFQIRNLQVLQLTPDRERK